MADQANECLDSEVGSGQTFQKEPEEFADAAQIAEDDRRAYVNQYTKVADFPFETGETVWIVKPGYRAPLGEFVITKAHPNNVFALQKKDSGAAHSELVEAKYLRRDPYTLT